MPIIKSHYLVDANGRPYFSPGIVLPKASGTAIRTGDDSSNDYNWRDLEGIWLPDPGGANSPAIVAWKGGIRAYRFVANDKVDITYHVPHDYAPGTHFFVHVHWDHTGTTISGTFECTVESAYAKGHDQAVFSDNVTATMTKATPDIATIPAHSHRLEETQMTAATATAALFDTDLLEPDGLVKSTFTVTGLPTLGGGGLLFVHHVDIHYQSTGIGTAQKAPDFHA